MTTPHPIPTRVLILGGGPAGLSAALYAARAELSPLVLLGETEGGQAALTDHIENYPGYPEGVNGYDLTLAFRQQAERFGAQIVYDTAVKVERTDLGRSLVFGQSDTYLAETLVLAMGASPRRLGVPGEAELLGRGVSYCATCDGFFFKDKEVIVVGGGDSAFEEALFLTRFARSVLIVHRREALRASPILQRRAAQHPQISLRLNTVVEAVLGEAEVRGGRLRDVGTGASYEQKADGVFVFIGHTPNSAPVRGLVELDGAGYVRLEGMCRTSLPNVFAAGEIADPRYRQVITSAGMGAAAGMEAARYLLEQAG